MDIFAIFEQQFADCVSELQTSGALSFEGPVGAFSVEPPRDLSHGDIATNIALILTKKAQKKPRDIAELIAQKIKDHEYVEKIDIAGPGFLNLTLKPALWQEVTKSVRKTDFGRLTLGQAQKINVEYVSANPTGPLHVGHCRGSVFGDALANLLDYAGYDVTREYYINDAGSQVDVLAQSAYLRYREALGEEIGEIPSGLYPGEYLRVVGQKLADQFGQELLEKEEAEWLPQVRQIAIDAMMDMIRDDLKALNIELDVFFSERSLIEGEQDNVMATIDWLREKGLVYEGRLPPPKGKEVEDWEDREQTLFRATDFGDDVDRALLKSSGDYTYFASDMTYHRNKFLRGFDNMIDVWGADHGGYVKRMKSAIEALTEGKGQLDVKICQMVRLFRAGEPVKMSKRSGEFVTLRDLVDEVGPDPVRFMMLYRKNEAQLDFDFAKVTEQSRDNPVFYVQYAHARAYSVFRNAAEVFHEIEPENFDLENVDYGLLQDEAEIALMKQISQFPRIVQAAALAHEPHRISFYLYDLAGEFHSLWNKGKESPQLRFIHEGNLSLTCSKLGLVAATATVLAAGLHILGVKALREMR